MVLAYHGIWTAYGFWLPNDERGSWSTQVWAPQLRRFGPATTVDTRCSLARRPFDPARRRAMRDALKYPPVRLTGRQALASARGIADVARQKDAVILACAVMPDHVHVVVLRNALTIEDLLQRMMSTAMRCMIAAGLYPLESYRDRTGRAPSPWSAGGWAVYLNTPADVRDRIVYVNQNPEKAGLPPQRWPFVQPYAG